ncbi:hypothetical protein RHMOL_Rhmol07G0224700 [Rhododendron molle]|uniref:Uncharacterized protein n=1 Tax=Rhododendron molle TaxID=49168 RepID=A0ACC0N3I1_RHOML|nr:hypothetical protein RHMOL_Rhmol07G0224700 [Rhododendron molle]
MKLPVDLTTPMLTDVDLGAKISSQVFMIIVMGNFLISFASRNNDESFMNILALGILVVTIVVDVSIELQTAQLDFVEFFISPKFYIFSMLMLLVTLSSLALTNPTIKRYMEFKYNELHETACEGGKLEEAGNLTHQKLKEVVEKLILGHDRNRKPPICDGSFGDLSHVSCYKGVADIDSSQVLNSWTMPVVTLTSIVVALPNVESQAVDRLISSVCEGLVYAGLGEESFSSKAENMLNLKCAADVVWAEVELYRKWLGEDLRKLSLEGKTIEETIQTLVDIAHDQRSATERPNVLAVNSMYKISQTILKDYEGNTDADKDGNLFEQLSVMIADIFGACLSNLSSVVIRKCYCSAIEEREKSVRRAARLLGEIEEILEILGNKQLTCLSGDRAADIEEGHVYMM